MYGNHDNMQKALLVNKDDFFKMENFAEEVSRRDMLLIDEALHLIEKYKKLGVEDYDELMIWITKIKRK